MKRLALAAVFAAVLCSISYLPSIPAQAAEATLKIGSQAPALDVEHWIQDGNGFFKPVKEFEKGNVYVVEFWATWCGPCIQSMPHLAKLQQQYRGQGVQIISITDETPDEVNELLAKEYPGEEEKSFNDVTAAYSLTADPDMSAHEDYMTAFQAEGIPTAFIVGKTGLIEWSGHPLNMDEPLAKVVDDSWDREAFIKEFEAEKRLERQMQELFRLAGQGDLEGAMKFINERLESAENEDVEAHWTNIRHNFKLRSNQLDSETIDYYREQLAEMEEAKSVLAVLRLGNDLFGVSSQGGDVKTLPKDVVTTLARLEGEVPPQLSVVYHNMSALMYEIDGDYQAAADAQNKAVEAAEPQQAKRMLRYLEELREKAEEMAAGGDDAEQEAEDAEPESDEK